MVKQKMNGIMVNGSIKQAGLTFYTRAGQTVVRVAHSQQPRRCSRRQFDSRMRMKHTIALWAGLRGCNPTFVAGRNVFAGFATLANRLPVVYTPRHGNLCAASFLMPGIPVSGGTMMPVVQHLGEVDGTPALLVGMPRTALQEGDRFRLYTLRQEVNGGRPSVSFNVRDVQRNELRNVDGGMALVDSAFGDDMAGWALVLTNHDRCSSQTVVTRCRYYLPYTTDEAMQAAVATYGGLTR